MLPKEIAELDAALAVWRQGDLILEGAPLFIFLADMAHPLSEQAKGLAEAGATDIDVVDAPGPGLVVVSQTCDLVRSCSERPYVELCPLVALDPVVFDQARRGRRPRYAVLSGVSDRGLAIDLDRTMTIEKAILAPLTNKRVIGVRSEQEARAFANAAARKRNRAALPEAFVLAIEQVRSRILLKHGNSSAEGRFLTEVLELRVRASPSWMADVVYPEVFFVYGTLGDIPDDADDHISTLLKRFIISDAYPSITGRAVSLETLPAADYLGTVPLDLENLSQQGT